MTYTRTSVSSIRLETGKLFDRVSENLLWRGGCRKEKLTPYAASSLEGESFLMTKTTPIKHSYGISQKMLYLFPFPHP